MSRVDCTCEQEPLAVFSNPEGLDPAQERQAELELHAQKVRMPAPSEPVSPQLPLALFRRPGTSSGDSNAAKWFPSDTLLRALIWLVPLWCSGFTPCLLELWDLICSWSSPRFLGDRGRLSLSTALGRGCMLGEPLRPREPIPGIRSYVSGGW